MRKNQAKKQANRILIQTATPKTICNNRPTQKPLFQQQPRQPECGSTDNRKGRYKKKKNNNNNNINNNIVRDGALFLLRRNMHFPTHDGLGRVFFFF